MWKYFLIMVICSVLMTALFIAYVITGVELIYYLAMGFMVMGVSVMVMLVFKMKKMFRGDYDGYGGEKTWRSYGK